MILSPYHNPPYRSPAARGSTSPSTPKRKRAEAEQMDVDQPSLNLETQVHIEESTAAGAQSPRTKVANKFRELEIRHQSPSALQTQDEPDVHRKRLKRQPGVISNIRRFDNSLETDSTSTFPQVQLPAEIEETPDCRTKPTQSPSPSPTRRVAFVEITRPTTPPTDITPHTPQTSPIPLLATPAPAIDRSASPLPSAEDLTPDQAALTWQEAEITGHEIDPSGEDDGEGINGIGFRPTPAMAAARKQRRRQQVSEWKAREAREARQKRMERRRRTEVELGMGRGVVELGSEPGRMVRFVGVER